MKIVDWGLVEYETSVERQLELVDRVSAGDEETIVFCTHPPVVTLGRATTTEDLAGWSGATFESSRGGRATYHGPNQVVIYPILDLRREHSGFPVKDIHAYLRSLENAVVEALLAVGVAGAEARTTEIGGISLTGVWVGEHKIASIGIAVRKWTTYHGVAINVLDDPQAFRGINPCGFQPGIMTSVEKVLGHKVDLEEIKAVLEEKIAAEFDGAEPLKALPV